MHFDALMSHGSGHRAPSTGWQGAASIAWSSRGLTLKVECSPPGERYLVYSPGEDADFFCFEPVSHDVNAHHFAIPLAHGLVELAPGQALTQQWRFHCLFDSQEA
ncbi:hypothetical protein ACOJCM_03990 [Billgrantia sp. LNSP4103-1]|uniref:hypothetical protein n=1 Tax=Billgrantia sp. LNSP4103-1 TaxID=3410266 RepID=UPI00403F95DD